MRRVVLWVAILLSWGFAGAAVAEVTGEQRVLEGGWFDLPPYAHLNREGRLTGFDVALLHEVGNRAGIRFSFRQIDWQRTQTLIRDGALDFGLAAFRNAEREAYALFSASYRRESDRLFLRPRLAARMSAHGESAVRLAAGQIDGFLADRLSGYYALADSDAVARPAPVAVFEGDVHVLFSRSTVPPALVRRFDLALAAVVADGTYERIKKGFVVPAMLDRHAVDNAARCDYRARGTPSPRRASS